MPSLQPTRPKESHIEDTSTFGSRLNEETNPWQYEEAEEQRSLFGS